MRSSGRSLLLLLLVALVLLGAAHYATMVRAQEEIIEHESVRIAEIVSSQALTARSVFTREVVAKLAADGFGSTPDFKVHKGFAPLPAQFFKFVGRDITSRNSGLYSYLPLSQWNLEPTQGLHDDFERWAWRELQRQDQPDPQAPIAWQPVWRFEAEGDRRVLRYMKADPASEHSCVACHNAFERAPEVMARRAKDGVAPGKTFHLHQLLGAIEVRVPLDRVDALAQQQARMTLGFVIATSFAAIAAVALWMWRDARAQRRLADRSQAQLSLQASAMQSALGNAGAAVALALQALRTARRARLQHHVAAALECLGDIRRGQGRADKGVEHWQRSRRGFEACGRLADAARVAGKLAEAQEALGERAQAAASRRRAHELAAQAQAQPTMQRVQQLAAELDIDEDRRRAAEAAFHTGKMAAIGRMVAAVSHELKRPLASLRLLAELSGTLLQRGDTTRVQHNLGQIVNLADRLAELTRTLEDFSRKQPYEPVPVRLRDSVGEALRILAPQLAGEDRIALGGADAWVQADAGRLRLVLVNLLSNAIEATAASADRRIEIRIRRDGAQAVLAVRDHGPGLSAEAQAHLFELFASTKPSGQGLGMGLALSAKVAREMGGELAGRNHPEGGAEFTLRLRLAVPAGETLQK